MKKAMNFSDSINNAALPLVFDNSVLVNVFACTFGERILEAIPNRIIIPEQVVIEFERVALQKLFLERLIHNRLVDTTDLTQEEDDIFLELTTKGRTIGDGESACIAVAQSRSILPFLDDGLARKRASDLVIDLECGHSVDIIRHPAVVRSLGNHDATEAIFQALTQGRMRVLPDLLDSVIEQIGADRAILCTSIPKSTRDRLAQQIGATVQV
jgi:predicted nucleic acid-binding protein